MTLKVVSLNERDFKDTFFAKCTKEQATTFNSACGFFFNYA